MDTQQFAKWVAVVNLLLAAGVLVILISTTGVRSVGVIADDLVRTFAALGFVATASTVALVYLRVRSTFRWRVFVCVCVTALVYSIAAAQIYWLSALQALLLVLVYLTKRERRGSH